jgi:hypothetical protein
MDPLVRILRHLNHRRGETSWGRERETRGLYRLSGRIVWLSLVTDPKMKVSPRLSSRLADSLLIANSLSERL